ncbi:MAG: TldD/PmbA family protein [Spirochaetia bacterium]|nr:TldD/PmbA family protein [Spirochaetia bacterium]
MREIFKRLASQNSNFTEFRFHKRTARTVGMRKGELADMSVRSYNGVGVRVLVDGIWGFASTSDHTADGIERAMRAAEEMARSLAGRKKHKVTLAPGRLAKGDFIVAGFRELERIPLSHKLDVVRTSEIKLREASEKIQSAQCQYSEIFEEKVVVTSDGADAWIQLARPELRLSAFAGDGQQLTRGHESAGGTGGWECLFLNHKLDEFIDITAKSAVDLLAAPSPSGGRKRVILSPAMVGLLSHEAIGHTVEADFVNSGSVARGRVGTAVASPLVTMCDSGASEHNGGAGGLLPVDDEGVLTERTVIIEKGIMKSYLHNRETAAQYGVAPTGNARAWEFSDEPLIRMRNTYIEPGQDKLDDMVQGIADGYFVDGPEGGQADATGEFMFGASRVHEIKNGKLGRMVQKVTVSGNAFDVLASVDAVSRDFRWDLGAGYCGKGQPAKVDAGGPYIRCDILIGGAS